MHPSYLSSIDELQHQLNNLLTAPSIKYSSWPPSETATLRTSGGVYHFFEVGTKENTSLYVGKAGLGAGKWSLFKRLSQHFQTSQTNTFLGKASKASGTTPEATKTSFFQRPIYLQWLPIVCAQSPDLHRTGSELFRLECFCKAVLNPAFTDA